MSPTSLVHQAHQAEISTPERPISHRQYMPMSSPAPFYRYSSVTTPATTMHERSSPPSSGAIDLAETLVDLSSPVKLREPFVRRISSPLDQEDSPRPLRNGVKSTSLGDLQGVDLLRGFEKISSWREGSSPIKEQSELHLEGQKERDFTREEHVFGQELAKIPAKMTEGVDGTNGTMGNGIDCDHGPKSLSPQEEDSQMTDVKMEG
jgi:hypothetical protein